MPKPAHVAESKGELASLVSAHRAHAMAVGWTASCCVLAATAAMMSGLAALLWSGTHAAAGVIGAIAVVAAGLSALSASRARQRRANARSSLDEAWTRAAGSVLEASGELTARALARAISTDEEHAELLLARLSAESCVRVDVGDDAELAYRAGDEAEGAVAGTGDARRRAR